MTFDLLCSGFEGNLSYYHNVTTLYTETKLDMSYDIDENFTIFITVDNFSFLYSGYDEENSFVGEIDVENIDWWLEIFEPWIIPYLNEFLEDGIPIRELIYNATGIEFIDF